MSTEEIKQPVWSVPDNPVGKVLVQRALVHQVRSLKGENEGMTKVELYIFSGEKFPEIMKDEYVQITEYTE